MFVYTQATGEMLSPDGAIVGKGYSGFGQGKNNPRMQDVKGVGPIPEGSYTIGEPFTSEVEGILTMRLYPDECVPTFDRCGFLIHGDSMQHPGCASHGCIILPRPARLLVAENLDKRLLVVEE